MPSVRHSVYLLKDTCTDHAAAVATENDAPIEVKLNEKLTGYLYIGDCELSRPRWMSLFDEPTRREIGDIRSGSIPAVLFVECAGKLFALTFGHGRHLIKRQVRVSNFGLRVVLNSIDPNKGVRVLDTQSMDGRTMRYRTQAPRASAVHDFGIDPEYTLLSSVTARAVGSALSGRTIVGRDSLQFTGDYSLAELPEILVDLLERYERDDYKDGFGWIDDVEKVRDEDVTDYLNDDLVNLIVQGNSTKLWLTLPEIIDWESLDHFEFRGVHDRSPYDDVSWDDYIDRLGGARKVTLRSLKNHELHVFEAGSEKAVRKWSIYDCMYAELKGNNQTYILNEGEWYSVSTSFMDQLDESVSRYIRPSESFPSFSVKHKDEDGYIRCIAKKSEGKLAIMHGEGNLISQTGAKGAIEFCDLYALDGRLCHLKQYGGSTTLSHLFNQGYVSTASMLSDSVFCGLVREKVPETHTAIFDEQCADRSRISVVFGVIDTLKDQDFELPLFSKISFRENIKRFSGLGVEMHLEVIPSHHWNERKRRRNNDANA